MVPNSLSEKILISVLLIVNFLCLILLPYLIYDLRMSERRYSKIQYNFPVQILFEFLNK
jgi:hypothetical protein